MINPARLRSDLSRLSRETAMLEATVASLSPEELLAPSLCAGWSRADVIAHLAAGAEMLTALVATAVDGTPAPDASVEAREAAVARLAALPREELLARLQEASARFASEAERLTGALVTESLPLGGQDVPATSLPAARIAEVVVHHHDLDTAWTVEEADPDSLLNAVEAAVRAMRVRQAPGMTLVTEERDTWVVGDGALRVEAEREGLLLWLARGDEDGVEAAAPLPQLPAW